MQLKDKVNKLDEAVLDSTDSIAPLTRKFIFLSDCYTPLNMTKMNKTLNSQPRHQIGILKKSNVSFMDSLDEYDAEPDAIKPGVLRNLPTEAISIF